MSTDTFPSPAPALPTALLVGATGLVGAQCLRLLAQEPAVGAVRVLVRRPLPAASAKVQVCVADFDRLASQPDVFKADWVFCALGTTIRKAGSQAAFRQVDFDYPLQVAQLAKAQGASRFMLVSALGADARSRVFYSRVKGELEEAVAAIGFESVTFARPSLLAGEREEVRFGERVGLAFGWLMPERYRPVQARQVAQGMVDAARAGRPGVHALNNIELRRLG
jgi:uncharacterized protein YbjT (DUF2867 family)